MKSVVIRTAKADDGYSQVKVARLGHGKFTGI